MQEIYTRYKELKEEIKKLNDLYYNQNISLIPDFEYDKKLKELEEIEKNYKELVSSDSPSQNVGSHVSSKFKKVEHKIPMLSLSNTYSIEDIEDFDNRIKKILNTKYNYILELKLDGLSLSVIYKNGILERAITRGDGNIGEDVTENILQIKSIPKKLNKNLDIEVRGEVVLPISEFNRINEERILSGDEAFANPRNAASGTLRQLDSNIVRDRNLDCYFYFLMNPEKYNISTHLDSIKFIQELGFKTTNIFLECKNIEEIEHNIEKLDKDRKSLDYETDGLVIKVNELEYYDKLGYTAKSPRWAIAYKFTPDRAITRLNSVDYQIGRTGVITPVANLEAVSLSGTVVKRASLHNFDEIARKDIRIGDYVLVEKAAEIIPYVISVDISKRKGYEKIISIPEICPVCSYKTLAEEGKTAIKCSNPYCPAKLKKYIEYFVSRDCMNIVGLGDKNSEYLIDKGYITNLLDLYNLNKFKDELINQKGFGKKKVENLLESIENSKNTEFDKIINSFGIETVGKSTATLLAKKFNNIDTLMNASIEDLISINEIGEVVASNIYNYFHNDNNIRIINGLKELGFKLFYKEEQIVESNITGLNFLATGKLNNFSRNDIKDLVIKNGANYLSSVSKNLDYLIVGEKAGSKQKKAEELGIKILTEDEFMKMIGIKNV